MPPSDLTKVISSSVVPVVIISACGLLALAFYNRLAAIVSRLRTLQRERLHEQELLLRAGDEHDTQASQRRRLLELHELQTAHVIRRARLIRLTLFFLLLTIGMLIGCCFMLGLSVILPSAVYLAIALFGLGLLSMLASTIAAMLELQRALKPVELESRFVTHVLHEVAPPVDDV